MPLWQSLGKIQSHHRCNFPAAKVCKHCPGEGWSRILPPTFQIFQTGFGLLSGLFLSQERENISFEKTNKKTTVFSVSFLSCKPQHTQAPEKYPKRLQMYLFNKASLAEVLENSQAHVANLLHCSIAIPSRGNLRDGSVVVQIPGFKPDSLTRWVRHSQARWVFFFLLVLQEFLQILHQILTQTGESRCGWFSLFNKHNSIRQHCSSWGLVYGINNMEFIPKDIFKTQFNSPKLHFSQNRNFQRKYCWKDFCMRTFSTPGLQKQIYLCPITIPWKETFSAFLSFRLC